MRYYVFSPNGWSMNWVEFFLQKSHANELFVFFFLLAVVNNDHVGNAIIHWMSLGYSCIFIILLL